MRESAPRSVLIGVDSSHTIEQCCAVLELLKAVDLEELGEAADAGHCLILHAVTDALGHAGVAASLPAGQAIRS